MVSREFLKSQNEGHIMTKYRNAFKTTKPTNPHEYPFQVPTYPLSQTYLRIPITIRGQAPNSEGIDF